MSVPARHGGLRGGMVQPDRWIQAEDPGRWATPSRLGVVVENVDAHLSARFLIGEFGGPIGVSRRCRCGWVQYGDVSNLVPGSMWVTRGTASSGRSRPEATLSVIRRANDDRGGDGAMTETKDLESINEALALIDEGLGDLLDRELMSTTEVADLLLDVRTLLSTPGEELAETVSPN